MPSQGLNQQPPTSIDQLQNVMLNIVYNFCSIFTTPIEQVLRIQYGSRYFPPVISFLTTILMILLPLFSAMTDMLPFARSSAVGVFGLGSLSKLYFLASFVHGLRIWRRMIHMEREENSVFEGPPLPFFRLLPFPFWMTRIIIEPIFVFTLAIVLTNFFILQPGAAHFLEFAAFMLFMKQYCAWFAHWQFLRNLIDRRNAGPVIAKIVDNSATEDELATMHLASLPKDIPDDLRQATASY